MIGKAGVGGGPRPDDLPQPPVVSTVRGGEEGEVLSLQGVWGGKVEVSVHIDSLVCHGHNRTFTWSLGVKTLVQGSVKPALPAIFAVGDVAASIGPSCHDQNRVV